MSSSLGHLFLLRGDLTRLACDAWVLPTSRRLGIEPPWQGVLERHGVLPERRLPQEDVLAGHNGELLMVPEGVPPWAHDQGRVLRLRSWPADEPEPWLVNVGSRPDTPADWYVRGVEQFLRVVRQHGPTRSRFRRQRPLIALPVVGTGKGGGAQRAGEIVNALLPVLDREGRQQGLDVALVTYGAAHHAAAQTARLRYTPSEGGAIDWWPDLDARLRGIADELARTACAGGLAFFLGAGISFNAGLPTWDGLLRQLADRVMSPEQVSRLVKLDYLEQAAVLEQRFGEPGRLQQAIVEEFVRGLYHLPSDGEVDIPPERPAPFHSLTQGLLASLPVREAVTTNYDCLFELAWRSALLETHDRSARPQVLPYERPRENGLWLLKLHGCLTRPHDIVLTRDSFIGYGENRAALAGLVQGLMLTRHLLFVGFSLQDYNFHRIAHAVRQVLHGDRRTTGDRRFGTALMLCRNGLLEDLWRDDIQSVPLDASHEEADLPAQDRGAVFAAAGRKLEVFLDYLAARTPDDSHLLDPAFESLLGPEDSALAAELRDLANRFPPDGTSDRPRSLLRGRLAGFLAELGRQG